MKIIIFCILCFISSSAFSQLDTINNGSAPGSGNGEELYYAFDKVNSAIHQINDNTDSIALKASSSDTALYLTSKYRTDTLSIDVGLNNLKTSYSDSLKVDSLASQVRRNTDSINSDTTYINVLSLKGTIIDSTCTFQFALENTVPDSILSVKYSVSALNDEPASITAPGIIGDIRFTATAIYLCIATNTWRRVNLSTF